MKIPQLEATFPKTEINIHTLYTTYAYNYSPSFIYDGEIHDAWELVFVNNGEVVAETNEESFTLTKNQAILHAPQQFHKIRSNNKSSSVGIITFGSESEILYKLIDKVIEVTEAEKNNILNILDEGLILMAGKNYIPPRPNLSEDNLLPFGSGQFIKNTLENLMISLIRKLSNEKYAYRINNNISAKNNIVQSVIMYLNNNLDRKITLKEISLSIGYSVSYICNTYKKHTGTSLIDYYLKLRIVKAKQLIDEEKLSFKEIAELLNFDSVQYFSTQFKKFTHLTPSQYSAKIKTSKYKYDEVETYVLK